VAQFAALERRTFSTGRDRVDHGSSGKDDACNSAALALVLAAERSGYDSSLSWVGGPSLEPDNKQTGRSLYEHPAVGLAAAFGSFYPFRGW
jgi:hypothetical protein